MREIRPPPKGQLVSSAVSPNGRVRAEVLIPNGAGVLGATLTKEYEVWLIDQTGSSQRAHILSADHTGGVRLRWAGSKHLRICYTSEAHIYFFRNHFIVNDNQLMQVRYDVEAHLDRLTALSECGAPDLSVDARIAG